MNGMADDTARRAVSFRVIAGGERSGLTAPGIQVARNREEFDRLWAAAASHYSAALPPPPIDWSAEMVIAVALGDRPSDYFSVQVDRLSEGHGSLTVHARETRPGNQLVTDAYTQPFTAIATPVYHGAIELETTITQPG